MIQNYSYTTTQTNPFLFDTPKETSGLNSELTDHLGNVRVTFKDISTTSIPDLEMTSWTDYYPFGEVMPGRNSNPENHLYGYQGQEKVGNGSKWYNFNLRMYNPSLGRFNTIDPYSQFNSPYLAMANNPISFVDPDGGRAVLTAWQREKLNRGLESRLLRGEYRDDRLSYIRAFMSINDRNDYQGFTFEEYYAYRAEFGLESQFFKYNEFLNRTTAQGTEFVVAPGAIGQGEKEASINIDGLQLSGFAAQSLYGNLSGSGRIDWGNSSTGDALRDAQIGQAWKNNGVQWNAKEGKYETKGERDYREAKERYENQQKKKSEESKSGGQIALNGNVGKAFNESGGQSNGRKTDIEFLAFYYEETAVYVAPYLSGTAAFTIPNGIYISLDILDNPDGLKDLLRHEFGHILQLEKWGLNFYLTEIAPTSLESTSSKNTHRHQETWTEWTANFFSYRYFGDPNDWNFRRYPIDPTHGNPWSNGPLKPSDIYLNNKRK